MSDFIKPNIVDKEIIIEPNMVLMSKTDKFGTFEFANDNFIKISGYEEYELMGKSMFCVQHPDMPETIYKMMWEKLLNKEEFHVVVKNLAKNGSYYWSITNFTFKTNPKDGEILAIYSKRLAANQKSKDFFKKLYKTLVGIEKKNGIGSAVKYIIGYLEENQLSFQELVDSFYKKSDLNVLSAKTPKEKNTNNKTASTKKRLNELLTSSKKEKTIKQKNDKARIKKTSKPINNLVSSQKDLIDNKTHKEIEKHSSKKEKSLFQKLFGKTDEEIEEERRRKANKK